MSIPSYTAQNTDMLSKYFSIEEATFSSLAKRLGIDNTIPSEIMSSVLHTASCMDKVRDLLAQFVYVDSFYRCPALNAVLGSKPSSSHVKGEAMDFISPRYGSPLDVCKKIVSAGIDFDQLILEYSWIHISFKKDSSIPNRKEVLTLNPDRKTYSLGLISA